MKTLMAAAGVGLVALTAGVGAAQAASAVARPAAELIPRKAIFGNPTRNAATLSPDGRHIAFLAPRDGVLNLWVAPTGAIDKAKPLSSETQRPIGRFVWAPDSSRLLYLQDKGGTEDFLLFGVTLDGKTTPLTPFTKTRVELIAFSPEVKDAVLVGINNRDPAWHDTYRLNPATGELKLIWTNPGGYGGVVADRKLKLVLAVKSLEDGGTQLERFGADGKLTPLLKFSMTDAQTTNPLYATDAQHIYMSDSRDRDTAALSVLDATTGRTRILAQDARADVDTGIFDPVTGEPEAYAVDYLKPKWTALKPALAADIAALDRAGGAGVWSVSSQSDDDRLWTVRVDKVTEPVAFHLYDRKTRTLTKLFTARPELEGKRLAAMTPLEIKSRDGKTMVSYLTLPPGTDPDGDGVPDRPVPMMLWVHGGPWARDSYGYSGYHQWFANRGYAVLSVNYRSSTGFGKSYISAGDLQWGRKMHDDLLDAVDFAVKRGVTTRDMVAIGGGSYGGYATLAGVTMTPTAFKCGVDIVGPSNLATLLKTIPAYWAAGMEQMTRRMGDPRTEVGRALLKERSPLTYAHAITAPLLIGQGANDPRVNVNESDQIVGAMKAKAIPVTYVVYPDEGHGFHRPENNISFNAVTEGFLSTCLGGAAQPIGDDFKGATLQVREGAQYVKGLEAALPAQAGTR